MSNCHRAETARCGENWVAVVRNRGMRYVLPEGEGLTHIKSQGEKFEKEKNALQAAQDYIERKL